jgi:hypothetical protein
MRVIFARALKTPPNRKRDAQRRRSGFGSLVTEPVGAKIQQC